MVTIEGNREKWLQALALYMFQALTICQKTVEDTLLDSRLIGSRLFAGDYEQKFLNL